MLELLAILSGLGVIAAITSFFVGSHRAKKREEAKAELKEMAAGARAAVIRAKASEEKVVAAEERLSVEEEVRRDQLDGRTASERLRNEWGRD